MNNLSKHEKGPAISEKAIPLPPPESMIIQVDVKPLTSEMEVVKEEPIEKNNLNNESTNNTKKV